MYRDNHYGVMNGGSQVKGKPDIFTDYRFSSREWTARSFMLPEPLRAQLEVFKLRGRKIKSLKTIGLSYNLKREMLEESAYSVLAHLGEEERQTRSEYSNIDPSMKVLRIVEVDEPFLIEFEDGDVLEILAPYEAEFRFSMNQVPWDIAAGTNLPNVDADVIFSECIGKEITDYVVNAHMSDVAPITREPYNPLGTLQEVITEVVLRFKDKTGLSMCGCSIDFCQVALVNQDGEILEISLEELKPGLYNWEDVHIDGTVDFVAEDTALFFGKKGAAKTE